MKIEVTTSPSKEDLKTLSEGIGTFNQSFLSDDVVYEKDTKFAVFAKNEKGVIIGGVRANAFWNYCMIELLWLSKDSRSLGVGSKLVNAAEKFAKENGFNYLRTETLSFQAKPFYEKLGFKVFGELPDYPKGHTTYCLIKAL